jgi:hypothetical protein
MEVPQETESSAEPLLGIYPKKHKSTYKRDTCTLIL